MGQDLNRNSVEQSLKLIISIALVYFFLAVLSAQISSITDFNQLLSFHNGFALAIMLTMSYFRALMGIALGALTLSIYHVVQLDDVDVLRHLLIPIFVAVIQAYISLKIYRKWINIDNKLGYGNELFLFLKVIPFIAIVTTLLSLVTSYCLGLVGPGLSLSGVIKIWVGHTASLVLVIPFVLSAVEFKDLLWRSRKKMLTFNFLIALILCVLVCSNIRAYENSRLEDRFKVLTNQTATLFKASLKEKELLQTSVAQFFISSKEVTRVEFKQFVKALSLHNQYIQVVEWLPKIEYEQRSDYEQKQAEYYGEDFTITQVKSKGVIIPALKKATYYPITYLEPERGNDLAKGFDPSASAAGKALIERAILSGKSQARAPLQILRNDGFKQAFIVYKPVYIKTDGSKTLDYSEGKILGFVNVVVKIENFIATIIGSTETANFNLQWQDTETGTYYFDNNVHQAASFVHVVDISLSSRSMKLIFTPTQTFIKQAATDVTIMAMLTIFVLAGLFSTLMLNITGLTSRIKSEVKLRTKELEALNKKLELLSNKDVLTELFNRRYFEQALKDEFERSLRYQNTFALIMFDIDDFKKINDQYGHPCGDKVIKAVADYLINTSRSSDVLARVGGEEFALILPTQSPNHIVSIVDRIRIDISNITVEDEQYNVQFTCSFGIAIFDESIKDIHTLIKMADKAMYKAKSDGKNRTQLFSEF